MTRPSPADLARIAKAASATLSAQFPEDVDPAEMERESLAWLVGHSGVLDRIGQAHPAARLERAVREVRRRHLAPLVLAARAASDPDWRAAQSPYTRAAVRLVLPSVWTGDRPQTLAVTGRRSPTDPATGGTWAAMVVDVSQAMRASLPIHVQRLLFERFVLGSDWAEIGASHATTAAAAQKAESNAVRDLCDYLNVRHHERTAESAEPGAVDREPAA